MNGTDELELLQVILELLLLFLLSSNTGLASEYKHVAQQSKEREREMGYDSHMFRYLKNKGMVTLKYY